MEVRPTSLPGVVLIASKCFEDERGFFAETYVTDKLRAAGVEFPCVQDNHVRSRLPYTIRGIHYQIEPFTQAKLVRVVRGSALDVAIDVRRGSPTFGRHFATTLTATEWVQMLVPAGFAHAIMSLEPDTEFTYKVTSAYAPKHERGIRFDDPDLAIPWGVPHDRIVVSPRDRELPRLRDQADLPSFSGS